jgi:hypothetical protein
MGIVDWFTNDLNTDERTLTRDLLSVAIADHEFSDEEQKAENQSNAVIVFCS